MSRIERADVVIAGSGFGGAIAAYRLAELYLAAGEDPRRIVVLERGEDLAPGDYEQSMHVDHLSRVYRLIQGQGAQIVTANVVGGGSNLYLAASLRAPSATFERRDRHPRDPGEGRVWPRAISRTTLDPHYRQVERALRVTRPTWRQVSRSGGLWAAALRSAGHTCDRVPLAIDPRRCVDAKWCHTGCVFDAKNTLLLTYLGAARAMGVRVLALREVQAVRQSSARPYRFVVQATRVDPASRQPVGLHELECKVAILATGAMNDAPILLRSRLALPALSSQVGRHLGCNGDHLGAIEWDPAKVTEVLGLPAYRHFHMGRPITTMSYDWWVGDRRDGERFTLQEIFLSSLTNFLYDDGRDPSGDPSWWGVQKKRAVANWASRIEILAMVQDTHDGEFLPLAPPTGGGAIQPNGGPLSVGTFTYTPTAASTRVREQADAAMREIASHRGLGRFMRMTETQGVYAAHPLGGCRMADHPDLGVVDAQGRVHGYEGLYVLGSSVIPTSLGVNPSLTIAAVAERSAQRLVRDAPELGLPRAPEGVRPRTPAFSRP